MPNCCKFRYLCLKWTGGFLSALAWRKFEVMTKWRNKLTQLTPVICIYDIELVGVIERERAGENKEREREEGNEGDVLASLCAQPLFMRLSNDGYFCFHRVWKLNWYLWEFLFSPVYFVSLTCSWSCGTTSTESLTRGNGQNTVLKECNSKGDKRTNPSFKKTAEICLVERAKSRIVEEMMKEKTTPRVQKYVEKGKNITKCQDRPVHSFRRCKNCSLIFN